MTVPTVPEERLSTRPIWRDRFVPWVAGWSTETWGVSRYDYRLRRNALFTLGRPGRGSPVFGVLNEPRQRECFLSGLCQICGKPAGRSDRFVADPSPATVQGVDGALVTEPWAHRTCMRYALNHCPALRETTEVHLPAKHQLIAQIIDPTAAPARKAGRFDPVPDGRLEVLAAEVKRHGGLVGYLKLLITDSETIPRDQL